MRHFYYFIALWAPLLFFTKEAECATQHDMQSWVNLTATGKLNSSNKPLSKIKYWLEGQERIGEESSHFTQTLLRSGLGYSLTNDLSVWLGYAWVYTRFPLTTKPFTEDRIWEQLLWIKTNTYLTFTSRTRMEQRFLENNPQTAYRVRQLAKIAVPWEKYPKWSWVSSEEIFFHKHNFVGRTSSGFDQNRFFIGLGYQVTPRITTEMGYMNQYIHRLGVPNFLANIASINFFLSL